MARQNIGNQPFIDHEIESGPIRDAGKITGLRNWTIRFGETDKETRKAGRSPVTMLPASTAIINVYQLDRKIKLHGKKDVSKKGKKGAKAQKPVGLVGGTYGFGLPAVSEEDGYKLNERGYLATEPTEDRSTYNKRVFAWLNKTGRINKGTQPKSGGRRKEVKEEEEIAAEISEDAKRIREERDEAERLVREKRKGEPRYILDAIVKAEKIKTQPTIAYYEQHPDEYARLPPSSGGVLDAGMVDKIKKVIALAKKEGVFVQKKGESPTIIAIQPTMLQPPTAVYIKKSVLSRARKKKMVMSVLKRQMKKPISHGNKKRKVVMKKGGKR